MSCGMVLSARMKALTEMVTPGSRVCDVGCDHGFVSLYLVQQGISPRVLAMDVRQGPLSRAQEHIRQQGLETYIETRLSDGLAAMEVGEADALICAGMGGRLMQRILRQGREKALTLRELILQPQSELPAFRTFLREAGYRTVAENIIYEEGKYYPMMKVVPERIPVGNGGTACSPEQSLWDRFGRLLLQQHHPVLKQYLLSAEDNNKQLLTQLYSHNLGSGRTAERIRELEKEQQLIRLALEFYGAAGSLGHNGEGCSDREAPMGIAAEAAE